ncbi:MAG: tetratricopeptide repeat protein [Verrucomicrobiota bacterium]
MCARILLLFSIFLGLLPVSGSEFEEANALGAAKNYEEAIKAYEALIENGQMSADLFFNLGVAQFRGNRKEKAALSFERALVLEPSHTEARQNLAFLDKTTGRLIFESTISQRLSRFTSFPSLITVLSIAAWLLLLGIVGLILRRAASATRTIAVVSIVFGAIGTVTAASGIALKSKARQNLENRAIVTSNDQLLRVEASTSSPKIIDLPPGSEVIVVADRQPWTYVEVPDELRGWIKSKGISPLWPYGSELAD